MARSRSRDYNYKPSYERTADRAERGGQLFDTLFKDMKVYKAREGVNVLRILPPGWEDPDFEGLQIMIHRNVGPEDRQYLCLKENKPWSKDARCPICEELYALGQGASREERDLLRPKPSMIYYVVDREHPKDGVQIWMCSATTASELAAHMVNHRTKAVLDVTHPEHGYDLEFTRTGTGFKTTRYRGFQFMREDSPLSDNDKQFNEWLDVALDKPLPTVLNFYSRRRIEEVFLGAASEDRDSRDDRDDRRDERRSRRLVDERRSRRDADDEDEDEEEEERETARDRRRSGRDEEREPERERPRRERLSGIKEVSRKLREQDRDEEDEEEEEEKRRPPRTKLARDLDDEIPSEGGRRARPNGRDEEDEPEEEEDRRPTSRRRASRSEVSEDREEEERPSRSAGRMRSRDPEPRSRRDEEEDEDEEEEERPSRARGREREPEENGEDRHEQRRTRMRERLNRGGEERRRD